MKWYILDENDNPVEADMLTSAEFFELKDRRRVGFTEFSDGANLSTVFLGLDHSFNGGPPVLFESLWFGGFFDEDMTRYYTKQEALAGHNLLVQKYIETTGSQPINHIESKKPTDEWV